MPAFFCMLSQEFESSEFDYLSVNNFEQSEQQQQQKKDEISGIERFWNISGNWGEFGAYFSGGLTASLIVRAIPAIIPAAVILIPGIGLGLIVYSSAVDGAAKVRSHLILIALIFALIAGNWDAWQAWIIANSQLLILTFALIVIVLGFVSTQIWSKLNVEQ